MWRIGCKQSLSELHLYYIMCSPNPRFSQCEEDLQIVLKKHMNLSQALSKAETQYTMAVTSLKRMKQQAAGNFTSMAF